MKSTELGVLKKSEVYFSSPSQTAKKLYYYPVSAGHFFCVKGYHLIRNNYNSLLITHIIDGTFTFVKDGKHTTARAGDTVILDCYKPPTSIIRMIALNPYGYTSAVQTALIYFRKLKKMREIL